MEAKRAMQAGEVPASASEAKTEAEKRAAQYAADKAKDLMVLDASMATHQRNVRQAFKLTNQLDALLPKMEAEIAASDAMPLMQKLALYDRVTILVGRVASTGEILLRQRRLEYGEATSVVEVRGAQMTPEERLAAARRHAPVLVRLLPLDELREILAQREAECAEAGDVRPSPEGGRPELAGGAAVEARLLPAPGGRRRPSDEPREHRVKRILAAVPWDADGRHASASELHRRLQIPREVLRRDLHLLLDLGCIRRYASDVTWLPDRWSRLASDLPGPLVSREEHLRRRRHPRLRNPDGSLAPNPPTPTSSPETRPPQKPHTCAPARDPADPPARDSLDSIEARTHDSIDLHDARTHELCDSRDRSSSDLLGSSPPGGDTLPLPDPAQDPHDGQAAPGDDPSASPAPALSARPPPGGGVENPADQTGEGGATPLQVSGESADSCQGGQGESQGQGAGVEGTSQAGAEGSCDVGGAERGGGAR